jgi:hypothetical protein
MAKVIKKTIKHDFRKEGVTPQGENSIPHPDATKIVQLKQQEGASLL